ncbi:hypothetical protein FQR65_LT03823 [Abscondita terminalis]|nr:hypothetical protein FQR65_LT03823 [Abscondita terminalis]
MVVMQWSNQVKVEKEVFGEAHPNEDDEDYMESNHDSDLEQDDIEENYSSVLCRKGWYNAMEKNLLTKTRTKTQEAQISQIEQNPMNKVLDTFEIRSLFTML